MNTCKTAFYHLQNIAKIRNCLSQDNAETLVHAFISSKLDFCNALLYGLPQSVIDRLQYVQNCAARLVTRTWSSEQITPVLHKLHWLPVRQRITYTILLLTYKALNGMAPNYIADLLQPYTPTRQLRSSSKNLLVTPKSNLKFYGDRSFQVAAPRLWSGTPLPVTQDQSRTLMFLKIRLKHYFLERLLLVSRHLFSFIVYIFLS